MEDQHILAEGLGGGELNRDTLLGMVGVAPGGEHCGHGGVGRCEDVSRRPPSAGGDPDQVLTDPGRKPGEHHLGLRVPKPTVELEHVGRTVRRQHQPGVQHALVGRALRRHLAQHGLEHLAAHPRQQRRRGHAHRGVGAHPAGVRAGVALSEPLVILRRREDHDAVAVGERQDG